MNEAHQSMHSRSSSNWRAYFELMRFPAVFTAIADVMMGYLVTHGDLRPYWQSSLLVAASASMYLAGMVLNDYYDADIDVIERSGRPIPSGRISRLTAGRFGWGLLVGGVLIAGLATFVTHYPGPICMAMMLGYFIYLYDRLHQALSVSPIMMGLCRTLNVLMGMCWAAATTDRSSHVRCTFEEIAIAAGIGIYIVGVTIFARTEDHTSHRGQLGAGMLVMVAGIVSLAFGAASVGNPSNYRWIVWLVIALYVVLRHSLALIKADARSVQRSVRHALRMLIFLDFVVAFEAAPHSGGSMLILLLFAPMLFLEYWFSTT